MLNKLKPKSEFTKNVLTLMTGTTIAQAIPIAISPILTRLYTPEDFGVFALFSSSVTILSIVIGGRYENAILLPKVKKEVYYVSIISLILGFIFMLILSIMLFLSKELFSHTNFHKLGIYIYLIPLTAFFILIYQILFNLYNRNKQYKIISTVKVLQNFSNAISNIFLGFMKVGGSGLIVSQIFSYVFSLFLFKKEFLILLNYIKKSLKLKNILEFIYILKKYKKFPIFDVPTSFLNSLSFQLPIYLFGFFFNPSIVGFFMFSRRIVGLPIVLLSSSIITVFKQRAVEEYNKYGNCLNIYIKTLKKLILISFIPFVILFLTAPEMFAIVFGEKWRIAGEYTQILVPMFFMRFISSPLSYIFYIANKQNIDMFINILLVIGIIISIYIGYEFLNNIKMSILLYSLTYIFFYITYLILSYKYAKGKN